MAHEKERELLERASYLIGNPGANISGSTDCACNEWQIDYKSFLSTLPDEKEESGWISVDKELPPSGNCVLLYSETGGVAEGAWIESKNIFEQWRWNAKKTDVTHWMPLPKFNLSNK